MINIVIITVLEAAYHICHHYIIIITVLEAAYYEYDYYNYGFGGGILFHYHYHGFGGGFALLVHCAKPWCESDRRDIDEFISCCQPPTTARNRKNNCLEERANQTSARLRTRKGEGAHSPLYFFKKNGHEGLGQEKRPQTTLGG